MHTIELLFPTTIYKSKIDHTFSETEKERITSNQYQRTSNGTFSDFDFRFLDESCFLDLKKKLQTHVDYYTKEIFKYSCEIYITQSWININPPGSYHNLHNHSNSIFSGVYYVTVPDNAPFLSFDSPIRNLLHIEPSEWNQYNSPWWTIEVKEQDVVIFPSSVRHEVLENCTKETRISIAFNTFVRGEIGKKHSSNYQIIK